MNEYVKTVGFLEPSFVIRKYLDAQRIPQLRLYLEVLHKKLPAPSADAVAGRGATSAGPLLTSASAPVGEGRAQQVLQPEHTMLLLNCYAKLRDNAALEQFIKVSCKFILHSMCSPGREV